MFLVVVDRKGLTSATGSGNSCLVTTTVTLTDSLDIDQYCGQCISEFVAHIPLAWPLDYCPNQVSNALLARSSQITTTMFDVLPQVRRYGTLPARAQYTDIVVQGGAMRIPLASPKVIGVANSRGNRGFVPSLSTIASM